MNSDDLKFTVREKYAEIAKKSLIRVQYSCCGNSDCCDETDFSMIGDEKEENEKEILLKLDTENTTINE